MPGSVPLESVQGSAYEEKIILKWREPAQTYGIITQFEVHLHQGAEPALLVGNRLCGSCAYLCVFECESIEGRKAETPRMEFIGHYAIVVILLFLLNILPALMDQS